MDWKQAGLGAFAVLLLVGTAVRVCGAPQHPDIPVVVREHGHDVPTDEAVRPAAAPSVGLSAPIAAAWTKDGSVVVAGLDVPSKAIRVQRIDAQDRVQADKMALTDVHWSPDADLKIAAAPDGGVAVLWRGLVNGKLARQNVVLNADLTVKTPAADVPASHCATRDALWYADTRAATAEEWSGAPLTVALPKDKEAALLCGAHAAFAILEEDERTSVLPLTADAGAREPVVMIRDKDFPEDDDERDVSEYTVGDDVGVVRLSQSGSVAIRELSNGTPGALHKLKTKFGEDDDIVAVDASPAAVFIVHTQDASSKCGSDTVTATRVLALRIDRQTWDETASELSPGRCETEISPFFTGALGSDMSIAWVERASGIGKARAPIVGLSRVRLGATMQPAEHVDQPADALVDAGCDGTHCWAAALVRQADNDAMTPGYVKILRW